MKKNFSSDSLYKAPESVVLNYQTAGLLCGSANSTIEDLVVEDYGEI